MDEEDGVGDGEQGEEGDGAQDMQAKKDGEGDGQEFGKPNKEKEVYEENVNDGYAEKERWNAQSNVQEEIYEDLIVVGFGGVGIVR